MTTEERITQLEKQIEDMKNMATFPREMENAIRTRIPGQSIITSSKSATSENKAVNEGGVSTYDVMNKPDGFLEVVVAGTTLYIPYFN